MEYITHSAIKMAEDGRIFTGTHHFLCIRRANEELGTFSCPRHDQGFITNTGRYVDRIEAAQIAIAAGQISKLRHHSTELFSEELCFTPPEYSGRTQIIRYLEDKYGNYGKSGNVVTLKTILRTLYPEAFKNTED